MSNMEHQPKMLSDDDLENSQTFKKLAVLCRVNPINTNDQAEIDAALASDLIVLVNALDKKAIKFENKSDEGALFRLMMTCHMIVSQIRPASPTLH